VASFGELRAAGIAFDGLWYSREGGANTPWFFAELQQRFPDGNTSLSYLGFDAAHIITLALNSPEPITEIESLHGYQGALGTVSALPNHSFRSERVLMEVRNGSFQRRSLN